MKRVLLDECLPAQLKRDLAEHQVKTVRNQGWSGIKNGELLALMEFRFDVFITADRNLEYQHNTRDIPVGIVVLEALQNSIKYIRPLVPEILTALNHIQPGQIIRIIRSNQSKAAMNRRTPKR